MTDEIRRAAQAAPGLKLLVLHGSRARGEARDGPDRASGLLRFKAASDGIAVHEDEPGAFERFRLDAISAWLDMAAVLGPAYNARLERLAKCSTCGKLRKS